MLLLVCADLVHDAKGKRLRVKAPVRSHLICNPSRPLVTHLICTSLPGSPFVVKAVASLRETTGAVVQASLHRAIVYGPEPGKLAEMVVGEVGKIGRKLAETVTGNEKVAREDQ
ncbi:hypothetical protein JHK82_043168 [Glycine max]|nr:hypothetical protein JHK86_043197 [Glycine max]KAG5106198.1 hypothetical protein JHK82_043168 [Glycine max]KAG5117275.1 hypothetical protein JHK84_043388 [Glycine max]